MNSLIRQKALIIVLFLSCWGGAAVAQTLMWAKKMGGTMGDFGRATTFDGSGNVYTVGEFRGTADFDPGPVDQSLTANGSVGNTNTDAFISKLDANGNYVWAKAMGGADPDGAYGVAAAPNGDVYMTGSFRGSAVDFNRGGTPAAPLTSNGASADIFVCKFLANGTFAWAVNIGGAAGDAGSRIVLDDQENVYVTGSFNGEVDFNPGAGTNNLGTAGVASGFVLKLNSAGVYQWAANIGASGTDIKLDFAGNVLVTGTFAGTVNFNPGGTGGSLISSGSNDVFVLKLTNAGGYVWAVKMGGTGAEAGNAIAVDRSNNVYTTGSFSVTANFHPTPGFSYNIVSLGSTDAFVSKLDASGGFIWAKSIGGKGVDAGYSLTVDGDDKVYVGGWFNDTIDMDPGLAVKKVAPWGYSCCNGAFYPSRDVFVLKLDVNGDYEWHFAIQSEEGSEQLHSINMDPDNNLYVTGSFGDETNFAPAPGMEILAPNGTADDIFIAKYAQPSCKTYSTQNLSTGCPTLTVNGVTYNANGTYEQILRNANTAGCDSVLTLIVALNNIVPTTINQTACNSFTFNNKTYTSSTTFRDTFQNANNCDSVVVHNLTINRSATTLISQTACNTYTFNGVTYTNSGTYPHYFQTAHNCDSTVMLNLTINNTSTPTTTPVTACGSYIFGGTTYTTDGTYTHTFQNARGCDSVATINLTINQATSNQINVTACNSYTYDGNTYTANGAYTHYFTNSVNCDSVVVLFLTLTSGVTSQLSATACNEYTLNGETYTATGIYTQTMTAANGCDSVITLNLTINQTPEATITAVDDLFVGGGGSSYQWLDCNNDYAPIPSATSQTLVTDGAGRYAVEVTFRGCKDTSDCMESFPAGIGQLEGDKLTIYPNPARDQVVIASTTMLTDASVTLINVNGQRIIQKKNQSGDKITLNLAGVAAGVYIVEVTAGEKVYRNTLLKE